MAILAVLFDLDDTLLWDERSVAEAFQATCRIAEQEVGIDPKKLEDAVRREARSLYSSHETYPFTERIGINPFEGLWGRFSEGNHHQFQKLRQWVPHYRAEAWTRGLKALGIDSPELGKRLGEQFPEERRKRPYVYDDTFEVLDELKGKYKLLLLTNGSPDLQKEKIEGVPGLSEYFEHIVISGLFGEGKPSVSIFHHALKLLGVSAQEAIMVGDKLTTDILGSHKAGIKNVWLNRHRVPLQGDVAPDFEIFSLRELPGVLEKL